MVEQRHTAGPWAACDRGDYADFDGNSQVILGDFMRVAVVHSSSEEGEANASLIAAAPDLLAALDGALAAMNYMGDVLNGMDAVEPEDVIAVTPAFEAVRAALAKARATSPSGDRDQDRGPR